MMNTEMFDTTHELVRDLFLFSVFTGLAYSDVKNLTTDNLQTFFDGNLWIITRRKKTNTESNIRLLDVPKKIIEKYEGMARNNKVFPHAKQFHITGKLYSSEFNQNFEVKRSVCSIKEMRMVSLISILTECHTLVGSDARGMSLGKQLEYRRQNKIEV